MTQGKYEVKLLETGDVKTVPRKQIFASCPEDPKQVEDLTRLTYINEATILAVLQKRAGLDIPYTFLGPVLVAINPLKFIPNPERVSAGSSHMPQVPHPYVLAERMVQQLEFRQRQGSPQSQSVIISGESGAGKTVTAKMVFEHVIHRCFSPIKSEASTNKSLAHADTVPLDERLLHTGPILEAFGNASTLRNDHSSRFGKFFKLHFDQNCFVNGATLETYLLERSRVTSHEQGERTFHIMYALVAGATSDEIERLSFSESNEFSYLSPGVVRPFDAEILVEVKDAFANMSIFDDEQSFIFDILAGILHLGNLEFYADSTGYQGERAKLDTSHPSFDAFLRLWGFNDPQQAINLLCERTISVGRETTKVPLTIEQARKGRDGLAKDVYVRLFDWICNRINDSIQDKDSNEGIARSVSPFFGVLDIFGFESFERNDLEQLLINFANERMQASFNTHVLQSEAELYLREGLSQGIRSTFVSNSLKRQAGGAGGSAGLDTITPAEAVEEILELIDEEAHRLNGSDLGLNRRIQQQLGASRALRMPHPSKRSEQFIIAHTTGHVTYTVGNFLEKNDDSLPEDSLRVLQRVDNSILVDAIRTKRSADLKHGGNGRSKHVSVSRKFALQMDELIAALEATSCSYVRCIKPNPIMRRDGVSEVRRRSSTGLRLGMTRKKSSIAGPAEADDDAFVDGSSAPFEWFDRRYVVAQLRSLGITPAALTLRDGMPMRLSYEELMAMFEPAIQGELGDVCSLHALGKPQRIVPILLRSFGIPSTSFRQGRTLVFFQNDQVGQLEEAVRRVEDWAEHGLYHDESYLSWMTEVRHNIIMQRWHILLAAVSFYSTFKVRMLRWEEKESAVIMMQRNLRGFVQRRRYQRLRQGAIMGQKFYRGAKSRARVLEMISELEQIEREAQLEAAAAAEADDFFSAEESYQPDSEEDSQEAENGTSTGHRVLSVSSLGFLKKHTSTSSNTSKASQKSKKSELPRKMSFSLRRSTRPENLEEINEDNKVLQEDCGRYNENEDDEDGHAGDKSTTSSKSLSSSSAVSNRMSRAASKLSESSPITSSTGGSKWSMIDQRADHLINGGRSTSRFDLVRKRSMAGTLFDEENFKRALAESQTIEERRDENLSRSYTTQEQASSVADRSQRNKSFATSETPSSGMLASSARNSDAVLPEQGISGIACVLGIGKRTSWKRRYVALDPRKRSVNIYAQRRGAPKNSALDIFRIHAPDFNPRPRVECSHDQYEMENLNFDSSSRHLSMLGWTKPGRYRLRIVGGKLDHDALQESRTLNLAFDKFDDLDLWRDTLEKLVKIPERTNDSRFNRIMEGTFTFHATKDPSDEYGMDTRIDEDLGQDEDDEVFLDDDSSIYAESTFFGTQVRCKNPNCQQINNSLYGATCSVCGWRLFSEEHDVLADDVNGGNGGGFDDDDDSLPPSISMAYQDVRNGKYLNLRGKADDDSFYG